ncbi:hypothetical protein TRFO_29306 [Tritrichomonas foetus]|uniref:Carbohydrate kinase PfkB domain-containing protein n=1 Tax=Tritrichomonas foetus TaxID=1144522 RepID=A0A1J4JW19_9EUKA|nr:hypothetical protein TRFO_29306 [Tritrichomonas foetus]|eukprot:OHT03327.1 hypothetical protein TRFO_29306 [Tritrichomonas foetus]
MTEDILFIGHCTRDDITIRGVTEYHPGGGSYFGAASAGWCMKRFAQEPKKLTVLTIGKPSDYEVMTRELENAGVKLILLEDNHTTTFAHSFKDDDPDQRISTVPDKARPYTMDDFKGHKAKIMYINPLFFGEVDPSFFRQLKSQCELISCDSQGLIRRLEGSDIVKRPPADLKAALDGVDILKIDIDEAAILTGLEKGDSITASRQLQKLGPRYIICTEAKGVAFYDGEQRYWADFGEWRLEGRTGRGDTLSASFILLHFVLGMDTQKALSIAAEGCSHKMMHAGAAIEADFATIQ